MTRAARILALLLPLGLLAGCAGQLRDYIGPRSSIVRPQLIRYGFSLPEIACLGERLGETLRPKQLRLFTRAAAYNERPFFDPTRFGPRDLVRVARMMRDQRVHVELGRALDACRVQVGPMVVALPPPSGAGPAEAVTVPAQRPPVWLNLGAASSGQAISVDAASLVQEESARIAWFRMIDPPPGGPSLHAYRLRIDCAARTIQPLGHRLYDARGGIADQRDYRPGEEAPAPVEGGTVTEIAFLSLCT